MTKNNNCVLVFIFVLIVLTQAAGRYDTFTYTPSQTSYISYCFVSNDLQNLIISPSNVGLLYYTANQNTITYNGQPTTANSNYVSVSKDLSIIFSYSYTQKLLRVYSRTGSIINLFQTITPSATVCYLLSSSADGNSFIIGFSNTLMLYYFNGVQYVQNCIYTTPGASTINYAVMSPDGNYIVYVQSGLGGGLTILQIGTNAGGTAVITQVFFSTFYYQTPTFQYYLQNIVISNPILGIYDIVFTQFYYSSTQVSNLYVKFDSSINNAYIQQVVIGAVTSTNFGFHASSLITLNGNYLLVLDGIAGQMVLYQKIGGLFTQIYNFTNMSMGATPYYIAEDASMIIIKNSQYSQLQYYLICNIPNCAKCLWQSVCQICNMGFQLMNNVCQCSGNVSTTTKNCVICNVPSCYLCSQDNICSTFMPNTSTQNSTQNLAIALIVFVLILIGIIGFLLYKLMKISSISVRPSMNDPSQINQLKTIQIDNKTIEQKNKAVNVNVNANVNESRQELNQQSHQTLNYIQPNDFQGIHSSLANFSSNIVPNDQNQNISKIKQRKRRGNLNINIKQQIQDNLQEISIQHSFRNQNKEFQN